MILNYSALLDLKGTSNLDSIRCVIGDGNVYRLNVLVALSGQIVDLTGHTARITFVKPDGHIVWQNMTIDDATSGSMYCVFENQVYAVEGTVQAEIELYDNGTNRLTTATFTLTARKGLLDDSAVESSSEFTALDDALQSVQGFDSIKSEIVTARGSYASLGDRLTALDNVQIGGTNLYLGSKNPQTWGSLAATNVTTEVYSMNTLCKVVKWNTTIGNTQGGWYQRFRQYYGNPVTPLTNGQIYTVSALVKASASSTLRISVEGISGATKNFNVTTDWQLCSLTFTGANSATTITFYGQDSTNTVTFYLVQPKLEEGNKATDWTPAPEDVTAYVNSVGTPFLGTTTNTGNAYTIPINTFTEQHLTEGSSFKFKVNADSTGAVQLKSVQGSGIPLLNCDGTAVTNIKAGAIITVTVSVGSDGLWTFYIN